MINDCWVLGPHHTDRHEKEKGAVYLGGGLALAGLGTHTNLPRRWPRDALAGLKATGVGLALRPPLSPSHSKG